MASALRALLLVVASLLVAVGAAATPEVSHQGRFPAATCAPGWALRVVPTAGGAQITAADLAIVGPGGTTTVLPSVAGTAFLVGAGGRVISILDICDGACPTEVRVLDLAGRQLAAFTAARLTDPVLSGDGRWLAWRESRAIRTVDLGTLTAASYPPLIPWAVANDGTVAGLDERGRLRVLASGGVRAELTPPAGTTRVALTAAADAVLAASTRGVWRADVATGEVVALYEVGADAELRDLRVEPEGTVIVGLCRRMGDAWRGQALRLDVRGRVLARAGGAERPVVAPLAGERTHTPIPWPLAPNAQHAVGNTYGEYQNYGSSYLHPGIDVMGPAGEPVHAVAAGVVKAILTTSGVYHWRIAIGQPGAAPSEGYLYAHVDQPTIAVSVGQTVTQGQYLGDLVDWPIADFTHCHFARIRDQGTQWSGAWLSIDNPHLDVPSTESAWPMFEPAVPGAMLAFCTNETSTYLDPADLHGAVDIIAHVGDQILTDWVCTVQEIRYSIYPAGQPDSPLVDDKLAVRFDMALDTYSGGPIDPMLVDLFYKQDSVCDTRGDYEDREFYHVITNSDGDETYEEADRWQAWNTTELPDGPYVVRVTARDVAGNAAAVSMTVTTANGNPPTSVRDAPAGLSLRCYPNPGAAGTDLRLRLPAAGPARIAVYDPRGRLVRDLVEDDLAAGEHEVRWDGRDRQGAAAAAGTYILRLDAAGAMRTERFLLVR